eukprot:643700-Amphidinium_carterae.1
MFLVEWQDTYAQVPLPKLQLLIDGEDPELFADRLQFAFESLSHAQARSKLNFFIDNMPVDDIPMLDMDRINRVVELSRPSKLKDSQLDVAAKDLVQEMKLDFARTMNKIIFCQYHLREAEAREAEVHTDRSTSVMPVREAVKPLTTLPIPVDIAHMAEPSSASAVPWNALCAVERGVHSFTQTFASFCFASLYIKQEVVATCCEVATECLWLREQCVYVTSFPKAARMDQFRQTQRTAITQMHSRLKERWAVSLQGSRPPANEPRNLPNPQKEQNRSKNMSNNTLKMGKRVQNTSTYS